MDKTARHSSGWSLERLDVGHEPLKIVAGGTSVEEEAKGKGEGGNQGVCRGGAGGRGGRGHTRWQAQARARVEGGEDGVRLARARRR
jgi:hypothetical protein